jgi:hypothetical protein
MVVAEIGYQLPRNFFFVTWERKNPSPWPQCTTTKVAGARKSGQERWADGEFNTRQVHRNTWKVEYNAFQVLSVTCGTLHRIILRAGRIAVRQKLGDSGHPSEPDTSHTLREEEQST